MGRHTPLYDKHVALGAEMVPFAGWDMPLHYGSQLDEHNTVRQSAGMFDVSHMGVIDLNGPSVKPFLRFLLANDIDKLKSPGHALYTCMLNTNGGVIDDLIVYYLSANHYRMVVNAGTTEKDIQWITEIYNQFTKANTPASGSVSKESVIITHRSDLAIIAVQGQSARELIAKAYPNLKQLILSLKRFQVIEYGDWMIARTGYTGEDGVEIILPTAEAEHCWDSLINQGIKPIGLGARDTLRLEAGYNLYGQDMDESVTPFESNLAWTVAFTPNDREFIGRKALENMQKIQGKQDKHNNDIQYDIKKTLIGLVLEERGVLRAHQKVWNNNNLVGEVTSGTFSPTLKQSIGFARVNSDLFIQTDHCFVEIRGKLLQARIVEPPFI